MTNWLATISFSAILSALATAIPVAAAVYAFARGLFDERRGKSKRSLVEHLGRAAAAGGLPSALILIVGAFRPAILASVPGINLQIALGGLSLLYVSIEILFPSEQPPPPGPPSN
jgi:hypothetical protein